ncbi:hypothetical protein SPI_01663 [Niveomyces insectorum RCEF 264]|uniref:Uncharacterized protein n=1 Tax=Niveomyces insectorum RCEF 264 TaxID=1081102 RepID=A0A167Z4S2_9HYPO|nr:hypothetical protein SPI_01663 [Niveomyces insectorum RCEF 264]
MASLLLLLARRPTALLTAAVSSPVSRTPRPEVAAAAQGSAPPLAARAAFSSVVIDTAAPTARTTTATKTPSETAVPLHGAPAPTNPPPLPFVPATRRTTRSPGAALVHRCHRGADRANSVVATAAAWLAPIAVSGASIVQVLLGVLVRVLCAAVAHLGVAASTGILLRRAARRLWACKVAQRLRRKLLFEVAVTVLGPGGNGLLLVVLWPGWLVLAAAVCTARACGGLVGGGGTTHG